MLYYFPDKNVPIFIAINMGTLLEGPYTQLMKKMEDELMAVVLK